MVRWHWLVWMHVPLALWAAVMEITGWFCPLTHLEYWLRTKSVMTVQDMGFVEQYLLPLLYPTGLTRWLQVVLGAIVLGMNGLIYSWVLWRHLRVRT